MGLLITEAVLYRDNEGLGVCGGDRVAVIVGPGVVVVRLCVAYRIATFLEIISN